VKRGKEEKRIGEKRIGEKQGTIPSQVLVLIHFLEPLVLAQL
jgi:hypothetical protein